MKEQMHKSLEIKNDFSWTKFRFPVHVIAKDNWDLGYLIHGQADPNS